MKRIISICLLFAIIFSIVTFTYAESEFSNENELKKILVSDKSIVIESNGASEFVDVFAEYADGSIISINETATWETNNQNIALAYDGRIIAVDKGSTSILVTYEGFTEKINVTVLDKINLESLLYTSNGDSKSLSSDERDDIISKASAMYNVYWTPTVSNIRGWKNKYTFTVGNSYHIPYSQTAYQVDDLGFENAFENYQSTGFYNNYTRVIDGSTIIMPKYGNDCSGFVSFCWGISRHTTSGFISGINSGDFEKVGSYDNSNPSYDDLMTSYESLQYGDAVVTGGHTFLIGNNFADSVICYEQTPYYVQITLWDYEDLANNDYRPFTLP